MWASKNGGLGIKKMYHATFDNWKVRPETYRDDDLVLEAQKDLRSDIPLDAIST